MVIPKHIISYNYLNQIKYISLLSLCCGEVQKVLTSKIINTIGIYLMKSKKYGNKNLILDVNEWA